MGATKGTMSGEEREYGSIDYWKNRYSKNTEPFEWLQSYEHIADLLNEQFSNKSGKVLNVGCGSSNLPREMKDAGWTNITACDWEPKVVANMKGNTPNVEYKEADAANLEALGDQFNYVIDKGLLDAILCGANSTQNAYTYLMQVKKILLPGGKFIIISHGNYKKRQEHLTRKSLGMSLDHKSIPKPEAKNVNPTAMGMQ